MNTPTDAQLAALALENYEDARDALHERHPWLAGYHMVINDLYKARDRQWETQHGRRPTPMDNLDQPECAKAVRRLYRQHLKEIASDA